MPKPTHHIIVCTNQRPPGHPRGSCGEHQANEVFEKLSFLSRRIGENCFEEASLWTGLDWFRLVGKMRESV